MLIWTIVNKANAMLENVPANQYNKFAKIYWYLKSTKLTMNCLILPVRKFAQISNIVIVQLQILVFFIVCLKLYQLWLHLLA